jgi:hypothetical protein
LAVLAHGSGTVLAQWQVDANSNQITGFAGGAVDLALDEQRTGGVVHHGEQMDLPALSVPGAPQRLAVDGDRPPSMLPGPGTVTVDKPPRPSLRRRRAALGLP